MFENIVSNIICTEYDKVLGRKAFQNKLWGTDPARAMVIKFSLSLNYDVEEGYRHLTLVLYGFGYKYIGVFAQIDWNVIRNEWSKDGTTLKKGKSYIKGETPWVLCAYHDSCWSGTCGNVSIPSITCLPVMAGILLRYWMTLTKRLYLRPRRYGKSGRKMSGFRIWSSNLKPRKGESVIKPITPEEAKLKVPDVVIEIFNELIRENKGVLIVVINRDEVTARLFSKFNMFNTPSQRVSDWWLTGALILFRKAGWKVTEDGRHQFVFEPNERDD